MSATEDRASEASGTTSDGSVGAAATRFDSASDLADAMRRASVAHGEVRGRFIGINPRENRA